jgi:uncharacterized protein (TIGR02246 family)
MANGMAQRVFTTIDAMDLDSIAGFFAEDGRVVFGNGDPLVGREAIVSGVQGFFSTIKGLRHRIVNQWSVGAETVAETEVTYRRLDGKSVAIPAVSIWHTRPDGLIDHYRVVFDLAPVYAP